MNHIHNGEIAEGAPNSIVREIQMLKAGLKEIIAQRGMCIYGSMEIDGDSERRAFQLGSAKAFNQMADMAQEILNGNP